jgi:predicted dehydrogenase
VDQLAKSGLVGAVTFNYRGNPLVQRARLAVTSGEIGTPTFVHGHYLQDWLLNEGDYSWRLDPAKSGGSSAVGDIGSHWCDLAQHITGLTITHVLGDTSTVIPRRRKPSAGQNAFQASADASTSELVDIQVEDLASILVRFENGAKGSFSVGQVCAGHKNDLVLEVCGTQASLGWRQEHQNELWIGHRDRANEILQKDPSLLPPGASRYAHLPGGHQEAWADAFCNVMRDIYGHITDPARRTPAPAFATFTDGYRANCVVEAILDSARAGGVWTAVRY